MGQGGGSYNDVKYIYIAFFHNCDWYTSILYSTLKKTKNEKQEQP